MQEQRFNIRLPKVHWTYLVESISLRDHLVQKLKQHAGRSTEGSRVKVLLTVDEADEIRDRCAEELQLRGFDEDYKHTRDGRILEDLIDYFFTG